MSAEMVNHDNIFHYFCIAIIINSYVCIIDLANNFVMFWLQVSGELQ
jgi:hypothetical protein